MVIAPPSRAVGRRSPGKIGSHLPRGWSARHGATTRALWIGGSDFLTRRGANSLCCGQQQKEKGAPPNQLQLTPPGLHEPEGAVCKVLTTDMPQQIDTLAEITRRSITKLTLRAAYTRNARLDPRAAEKVFWAQNVTAICEQNRNFRSLAEGSV